MSRLPIHRSSAVEEDIRQILFDSLGDVPEAALRVGEAIDATIAGLSEHPHLGEVYSHKGIPNLRRMVVSRFTNYSVYYQVRPDDLLVVRVLHNSRDANSILG